MKNQEDLKNDEILMGYDSNGKEIRLKPIQVKSGQTNHGIINTPHYLYPSKGLHIKNIIIE